MNGPTSRICAVGNRRRTVKPPISRSRPSITNMWVRLLRRFVYKSGPQGTGFNRPAQKGPRLPSKVLAYSVVDSSNMLVMRVGVYAHRRFACLIRPSRRGGASYLLAWRDAILATRPDG